MNFELDPITDTPDIEEIELWQSQCFVTSNPYHNLLKEALCSLIYADAQASETAIKSDVAIGAKNHLFESELDFLHADDADIQTLRYFLTDTINSIAVEMNQGLWPEEAESEAIITESWYHITQNGGYHDAHSHPNCSWCGIYYLDIGESNLANKNGVNRFYDPRVNADHYLDAGSQYLNGTGFWDIAPVEGHIIIFPSYLKHSALPYLGKKDRVIIAFNAQVHLI